MADGAPNTGAVPKSQTAESARDFDLATDSSSAATDLVVRLPFDLRLVGRVLLCAIVALVALSSAGQILKYGFGRDSAFGLVQKFWLDSEANVPTYFSGLLLLSVGLAALANGAAARQLETRWWRHWFVIALLFAYLSFDEAAAVHDRIDDESYRLVQLHGFLRYQWVVAALPILAALTWIFGSFVFALPASTRIQVILAACVFVGGAVGVEMLGGKMLDVYGTVDTIPYAICATTEETMEMMGALLCLDAFLRNLETEFRARRITLAVTS